MHLHLCIFLLPELNYNNTKQQMLMLFVIVLNFDKENASKYLEEIVNLFCYKLNQILNKSRTNYFLVFLIIILLGILSRKISFIPLWIGDFLYSIMIFFLVRIIFPFKKGFEIFFLSLLICYCIEFLQLYQAEWIIELRKTLFGRYVLGQGFLWSDILAYTFGIAFVFIVEKSFLKYYHHESSFRIKQQK